MMKTINRFLSKLFIAIVCVMLSFSAIGETNMPGGIGDYGSWTTAENMDAFTKSTQNDLTQFRGEFEKQLVSDYVPIEARVGIAMMNGLTHIAKILDTSLVRFMVIFIIVMYLFWIMFESYNFMHNGGGNVQKFVMELGKKAIWIIIWITVLELGPARLFIWAMGPIVSIGTYLSDLILNSVAYISGANLPDTCNAIHEYAIATTPKDLLIDANAVTDLMCVPTRLSGFFTTGIAMGWKWMIGGSGHSAFSFIIGAVFIVVFAWNTLSRKDTLQL